MATELRSYVVHEGEMDAFLEVWRDEVVPRRERAGFTVDGAWVDRPRNRFVWVVSHPAPDGWRAAMDGYLREREGIDPDPGVFLESIDAVQVDPAR
jgi:hypothetical protein